MSPLPLDGLKVLDLTRLLPGGFCSLLLADFGADVIKVEDTGAGRLRPLGAAVLRGRRAERAERALFLGLNRGKRSIRIDLKSDRGREVLLRLVRDADVLLESFRPGVMDRLGVGYERLREENPRPRLLRDHRLRPGRPRPRPARARHQLPRPERDPRADRRGRGAARAGRGSDRRSRRRGLMAASGSSSALHERERSGEGQLVDCSMFDGSLSWLVMLAAEALADGSTPRRGALPLAGGIVCYRPYPCADGYVTLGALEPKFWSTFCHGVGREDLLEQRSTRPGSGAHRAVSRSSPRARARSGGRSRPSTTAAWSRCWTSTRCLTASWWRAREMVVELDQPGAEAGQAARGAGQAEPDAGRPGARAGPRLSASTPRGAGRGGLFAPRRSTALHESGAVVGPSSDTVQGSFMALSAMATATATCGSPSSPSARASAPARSSTTCARGCSAPSDDVVRTSRNMAYYPPKFVERIQLIKRLQEERFMPLKVIRELIGADPERAMRMIELEDRILDRAIEARETGRVSRAKVRETYDVPQNVLDRLEQLGVLAPNGRGYDHDDVAIIEAISRFRAGGYEEAIGFTVYDTLRYREALEPLVEEEVRVLLDRLAGKVDVDRAVQIISSGADPLRELIGAMHSKLLLAALRRQRGTVSYTPD